MSVNDFALRKTRLPEIVYWPQTWDGITSLLEFFLKIKKAIQLISLNNKRVIVAEPYQAFALRLLGVPCQTNLKGVKRGATVIVALVRETEEGFRELVSALSDYLQVAQQIYILDPAFGPLYRRYADASCWFLTRTLFERRTKFDRGLDKRFSESHNHVKKERTQWQTR